MTFILYVFCQIVKDNSIIDMFWGILFFAPLTVVIATLGAKGETIYARSIIVYALITIWAFRLSLHIWYRHRGEDFRYA